MPTPLTDAQRGELIRMRTEQGMTYAEIATATKRKDASTVYYVLKGHVPPKRKADNVARAADLYKNGISWEAIRRACGYSSTKSARASVSRYLRHYDKVNTEPF